MTTFTARYPGRRCGVCEERINVGDTAMMMPPRYPAHAACSTADIAAQLRATTDADAARHLAEQLRASGGA